MKLKRNYFVVATYRLLEKHGLKKADMVISVSQEILDTYLTRYPWLKNKSVVVPVGINIELFKPLVKEQARKNLQIPMDKKVMLVVARLEKEKNVKGAIEVVKEYLDAESNILMIAGTGEEEDMLKELASTMKKAEIRFLGQVPNPNLPEIIAASDVVIVPSLFESGPLIILEAMACGVPCVSTDVGRAREFLENSGCGYVISELNGEFASKVKELLSADASKFKQKCISNIEKYSFSTTGEKTMTVFEKALEVSVSAKR